MKKRFIATLHDMSHIPEGSVYRGSGKVDFEALALPDIVKERLVEYDSEGAETFRKPGFIDVIPKRPSRGRP